MYRHLWSFPARGWLLAGLLIGCGPGLADYRQAIQEQLAVQEELLQILQKIHTPADLAAARKALRQLEIRATMTTEHLQRLPPPNSQVRSQLETEFADRLQSLYDSQRQEVARIRALPGGAEFFAELEQTFGAVRTGYITDRNFRR